MFFVSIINKIKLGRLSLWVRPSGKNISGFTLPELLIVMTVLAALAALIMTNYPATQRRARDTRRKSDIKQYQTALELYNNNNNSYPVWPSGNLATSAHCATLGITACPNDPQAPTQNYGASSTATQYVLWARLQQPASTPPTYFILCSNGIAKDFQSASAPTFANCT